MTQEILFRSARLEARPLRSGDEAVLQKVFEAAGDYFLPITGRAAPDADAAEREIRSCEATAGREAVVLHAEDGSAVGVLGWWEGSPEPDIALLGMVLMVPESRGAGLAREGVNALESHLASRQMTRLRTGVGARDEKRQAFVRALGFAPMDERTHVSMDRGRMMISLFEKSLSAGR
jgi:RimJ/RimL family protein N-acetyltransferase